MKPVWIRTSSVLGPWPNPGMGAALRGGIHNLAGSRELGVCCVNKSFYVSVEG